MKAMNLKVQITFFVILLIMGLVAAFSLTTARIQRTVLMSEIRQKVVLQGRNLALSFAKPLLHEDPEFELHPHISRIKGENREIVSIVVVDNRGLIKGHSDLRMIDEKYGKPMLAVPVDDRRLLKEGELLGMNGDMLFAGIPVTEQGERIGFVYLEYSALSMKESLEAIYGRIIRIGLLALGAGAVMALLLASHITRPISRLTAGAELIGEGRFDTRIEVRSVSEIKTLAGTFNRMAASLEESRKVLRDKERMDKELEIARSIQQTLLPGRIPELKRYSIAAFYNSAEKVGGDYYDIIRIDDDRLMLVVGDVSGKGVPGLVVMAMARLMVRDLAQRGEGPARLLRYLNWLLKKDIGGNLFLTMFCGILDQKDGTFCFASAAHMPLIHYSGKDGTVRAFRTKAKPLGFFDDEIFEKGLEESVIRLEPGDLVLEYTDGVSEMRNSDGEEFGIERTNETVNLLGTLGADGIVEGLMRRLDEFRGTEPQSDDLTLLAVSMKPETSPAGTTVENELIETSRG